MDDADEEENRAPPPRRGRPRALEGPVQRAIAGSVWLLNWLIVALLVAWVALTAWYEVGEGLKLRASPPPDRAEPDVVEYEDA